MEAVPGQRDNFALRFKCQLCKKPKIVKSDSKAPTSNLTSHINHCHPECSDDFSDAGPFKRAPRGRKNISASNNISAVSIDIIWIHIVMGGDRISAEFGGFVKKSFE